MSLEDLLNVQVTSVSKHAQPLSDAAAAIYVITADDIKRSGATNIPDALRMVPGLHVGRIDASKWAVSARGFNGRLSNKLLVLIDGRSVYTSLFSGVYWEDHDVLLADIDRIEIIRGPGSTLWGANAVNGVINIITKHAADTQGGYLTTAFGSEERGIAGLRYGTGLGDGTYLRVHAKAFERDGFVRPDGTDAFDGWNMVRGGFRLDTQRNSRDALTLQGDAYSGNLRQEYVLQAFAPPYETDVLDRVTSSGWNLLGRWQRTLSPTSDLTLQAYYNVYDRDEYYEHDTAGVADLDFQHSFAAGAHEWVWGAGYRRIRDNIRETVGGGAPTPVRVDDLYNAFLQDQVPLFSERLKLTLGAKLEHNAYTDYEIQPSLRVMWRPGTDHRIWGAISRAVRTPSRGERELKILAQVVPPGDPDNPLPFPVAVYFAGSPDFASEELLAHELGYRFSRENLSMDVTLYLNEYTNLRSVKLHSQTMMPTHLEVVQQMISRFPDRSRGGELAAVWRMRPNWRWDLAYSYYDRDHRGILANMEAGPRHLVSLRSSLQPGRWASVDLWLRHLGDHRAMNMTSLTESYDIEAYTTLDARVGLVLSEDVDLSLVGQNLLHDRRFEYAQEAFTRYTEIQRGFYVGLDWRF